MQFFPDSPFTGFIESIETVPWLGYLNWFVPVGTFVAMIDRQIRSLVEYQIIYRKASNYKTLGFFLGLLFGGNLFIAVTQWYGVKEKINSEMFVLRQKYARLYDSYKIFGGQTAPGTAPARGPGPACPPETVDCSSAEPEELDIKQNVIKTVIAVQEEQAEKKEEGSPQKYSSFSEFWLKQSS